MAPPEPPQFTQIDPGLSQRSVTEILLVNGRSGKGSAEPQAQASGFAHLGVPCFANPTREVPIRLIWGTTLVENSECAPLQRAVPLASLGGGWYATISKVYTCPCPCRLVGVHVRGGRDIQCRSAEQAAEMQ